MSDVKRERLWKWLGHNRQPHHGGSGQWPEVGEWLEVKGELVPCEHGIHLCREQDLLQWCAPTLYEAEYDGERIDESDKIVVRRARLVRQVETWNDRTARLFACDCAERVLLIFERDYPQDDRPRRVIEVARRFARGEATAEELAAAWAAARAAARAAAWEAAGTAAWEAARAAAGAAAWAAAGAAAWDAERSWQTARLLEYLYGETAKEVTDGR